MKFIHKGSLNIDSIDNIQLIDLSIDGENDKNSHLITCEIFALNHYLNVINKRIEELVSFC